MQYEPQRIIVSCPNWVGDVVMATAAFRCLRANFPKAEIWGLIRNYAFGVIESGPWFDAVLTCDDKSLKGMSSVIARIAKLKPDMALVLPNTFRAALIMKMAGVKYSYGYKLNRRSWLLSGGPKPLRHKNEIIPRPMVEYYLEICRWLDLEMPASIKTELFISDSAANRAEALLEKYGIRDQDLVVGLNPGAKFGSSKCWPPEYFAALAELLEEKWGARILLFVGPGEDEIAQKIVNTSKAEIINTAADQIDLSLLKPMIKRCELLISNDTGPRHYAVALDIPVVVIMGSTDPRYTAANLEKTVVVRKDLPCAPCHKKECPYGHECMTEIKPEQVFKAAQDMGHRLGGLK